MSTHFCFEQLDGIKSNRAARH